MVFLLFPFKSCFLAPCKLDWCGHVRCNLQVEGTNLLGNQLTKQLQWTAPSLLRAIFPILHMLSHFFETQWYHLVNELKTNKSSTYHTSKSGWTIHSTTIKTELCNATNQITCKPMSLRKHFISNVLLSTEPPWVLLWKLFRYSTSTNSTDKHDFSWSWRRQAKSPLVALSMSTLRVGKHYEQGILFLIVLIFFWYCFCSLCFTSLCLRVSVDVISFNLDFIDIILTFLSAKNRGQFYLWKWHWNVIGL